MFRIILSLSVATVALTLTASAHAADELFPDLCETTVDGKMCKLRRTGVAVRYKSAFSIYVIASYLQEGGKAKDAPELLASNEVKQLRLHFLIGVSSAEMCKAFCDVFRGNHPEPKFKNEVAQLLDLFQKATVKRGDDIILTHVPKTGLVCKRPGAADLVIANVEFSRAVWENYLGKVNTGEEVKKGLVSELP